MSLKSAFLVEIADDELQQRVRTFLQVKDLKISTFENMIRPWPSEAVVIDQRLRQHGTYLMLLRYMCCNCGRIGKDTERLDSHYVRCQNPNICSLGVQQIGSRLEVYENLCQMAEVKIFSLHQRHVRLYLALYELFGGQEDSMLPAPRRDNLGICIALYKLCEEKHPVKGRIKLESDDFPLPI